MSREQDIVVRGRHGEPFTFVFDPHRAKWCCDGLRLWTDGYLWRAAVVVHTFRSQVCSLEHKEPQQAFDELLGVVRSVADTCGVL